MRESAELLHVAPPGLETVIPNGRLGHVVDDDRQDRVALDEPDGVQDVARLDQGIEGHAQFDWPP